MIQVHLLSAQLLWMMFSHYNPNRKRKMLIVSDDMIADIMTNEKIQAIIKELFIRCRKLNISLAFITQSYSSFPKDVKLNSTERNERISKYCNQSFYRYWLWRFCEHLQKMYKRTVFFCGNWYYVTSKWCSKI